MLKKDESGDYICERIHRMYAGWEKHGTCYGCPLGDAIDNRQPKDDCQEAYL